MMKVFFTIGAIALSSLYAVEAMQHKVAAAKEFHAKAPKPVVLDVRTAEEFSEGPLPGAVMVTIGGVTSWAAEKQELIKP